MNLNFEVETVDVTYGEDKASLRMPSHMEVVLYLKELAKTKGDLDKQAEVAKEYVVGLGMGEVMYKKLPSKVLFKVIGTLNGNDEKN